VFAGGLQSISAKLRLRSRSSESGVSRRF